MKKTLYRLTAVSCLIFAAAPAWSDEGMMMRHGEFADKMFKELDTNGDGSISKAEFDAFHNKRFKELDANHDGKITREEMEASRGKMMEHAREQFEERFKEADANHDGSLSKDEAQKMPWISQHFDEIDANHDGKVSRDEIHDSMEKMHHGQGGMHGDMHGDMHGGNMPEGSMMHKDAPAQ